MRRVHVVARGRVQGVFYRASCAERARALGLAGWIRNTADGEVEAEFEGPPEVVAAMVSWCSVGPPHAVVEHVEVEEAPPTGETGFRIVR
ncbi:MAG TPA: acylphosphatase [Actinomycetota bacterium]|nr:acylphosphatase [Actinomycetota bacterium]